VSGRGGEPGDLLGTIPLGRLLSRVLRLLVSSDRREEFVGDLVEQVNEERTGSSPWQIGLWLWGQTLHSAPSLLALRVRRLARRGGLLSSGFGRPQRRPVAPLGVLASERATARSWPVPMAVSVTVHALALFSLVGWTLRQIEEVEQPWVPVVISRALAPRGPLPLEATPARDPQPPRPARAEPRPRKARAATPRPIERAPVPPPEVLISPPAEWAADMDLWLEHEARPPAAPVALPPQVAEKRCLSCPPPRLPPAYVRLGAEQQILVKTCVDASGDVTSVDVLRGLGATADAGIVDTVRGWRFAPHSVDDHPVPFCYPTRFVFAMN
jgi:TonB family protein